LFLPLARADGVLGENQISTVALPSSSGTGVGVGRAQPASLLRGGPGAAGRLAGIGFQRIPVGLVGRSQLRRSRDDAVVGLRAERPRRPVCGTELHGLGALRTGQDGELVVSDVTALHEAIGDIGAGFLDLLALVGIGIVGLLLGVADGARHVRQDEMRAVGDLGQMPDQFLVLELVQRAIAILAVGKRLVRQRGERFDHLASKILAQLIVQVLDPLEQDAFHPTGLVAVKLMCRGLGGENAAIEIGRHQPIMRAELNGVRNQRTERQRLQLFARRAPHRDNLVFVGAAALGVDVLPEELLHRIVCRGPSGGGRLLGKGRHRGQTGFGTCPDIDPIDGKPEAIGQFAAERPCDDSHVVVSKGEGFHIVLLNASGVHLRRRRTHARLGKCGTGLKCEGGDGYRGSARRMRAPAPRHITR
jgi:hypothetical protein